MASAVTRARIVAAARAWIGTPYRHQASLRGVGADCLGLVRGVWRDIYGTEPEAPEPYSPNWAEETGEESLRDAGRRHLVEIAIAHAVTGDIVMLRMKERSPAKHVGILADAGTIIHAYDRHAVIESAMPEPWRRRIAYAFQFPGVEAVR